MVDETFDYPAYLAAKKAVDDRSLNPAVWSAMAEWARSRQAQRPPLRVLEIGAGTGTMIERLLESGLPARCHYTALEQEPGFAAVARERQRRWAVQHGYRLSGNGGSGWHLEGPDRRLAVTWLSGDILAAPERLGAGSFDLLIGHAVVDLLPVPRCLPPLLDRLGPDAAGYLSLNYAGRTDWHPAHPLDGAVLRAYHRDMDRRFPGLDWRPSRTGRLLKPWLAGHGCPVTAEGPSDWRVPLDPRDRGETLFIGNILDTIAKALAGMEGLAQWLEARRRQLAAGELALHVANRDCFFLRSG